ncbi:hypothetical protein HPB48_008124 [Haemaphysalis longicornis]|uniref:CCHC-type domain-containing protein n=1 Tax=Haemaphysalis longicornis TaxID=44386 RepID=A0A9J6GJ78_HAELO|nr:hypothetical protein HPB48_008124 [Haemaphysalis longicornis]
MEFDTLSGRTIPPPGPWKQILRERRNLKQQAAPPTSPFPVPCTQQTTPRSTPTPRLPDKDYKVIYRPRTGLRVAAYNGRQMTQSIQQASKIPEHVFNAYVTIQPQALQNLIVASTPDENCAMALSEVNTLQLGAAAYEVLPYLKPPPGTVRGVIHGLDQGTTTEQLPYILASNGPRILHARMLGTSTSAVVTFEGPHVPFYIKAYGLFTRCRPYRQTVQCCSLCGELGHRQDVCPNPDAPVCAQCHARNPTPGHECTPTCQLCGLDHPTASKDCRRKLRPPPPPVRVRERASAKQQTFHNPPDRQTQSMPHPQNVHRPAQTQVSWSAVVTSQPTALDQFPSLPTHPNQPPTSVTDTRIHTLEEENARLRQQLEATEKRTATLEQRIHELLTKIELLTLPRQEVTAAPSAPQVPIPTIAANMQGPSLPSSDVGRIETLIREMGNQFNSRFAALEERLVAIEETERQAHKKPKQHTAPQDPNNATPNLPSDDDTF